MQYINITEEVHQANEVVEINEIINEVEQDLQNDDYRLQVEIEVQNLLQLI